MGRTAMKMLLERLEDPARSARKVVLSGRLIARGSTAHNLAADARPDAH
ncbi:substrate-binding domain-containing protein [Aquitalea sp. ASV11]